MRKTNFDIIEASDTRTPGINHVMVANQFGNYAKDLHNQIEKATLDRKIGPEVKKMASKHLVDFSRKIYTNSKNDSYDNELITEFIKELLEILGLTDQTELTNDRSY